MRMTEKDQDEFVDDHFPNMAVVREWNDCKVWTAGVEEHLLILFDRVNQRATVYDCDSREERQHYVRLVLRFKDNDDEAGAAVLAVPPSPPRRTASNAEPLPTEYEDK